MAALACATVMMPVGPALADDLEQLLGIGLQHDEVGRGLGFEFVQHDQATKRVQGHPVCTF
jgi:hypothetical protein